eukprot:TRINITY_DN36862_c0_g1_i1.p2 TRINITY_DN36862_c0_g1~~TRINITY_DN36862_c0_g1_i1.p2  ORF type:complete len:254 (+),score=113.63 TRINITY_DN36862_c0_g1_i1:70-831(+)
MPPKEVDTSDSEAGQEQPAEAAQPSAEQRQSDRQTRLAALRLQLTKAKNMNAEAALDEHRRRTEGDDVVAKRMRKEAWEAKQKEQTEDAAKGFTVQPELLVTAAAQDAREKKRKRKDKAAAPMGWDMFNTDTQHATAKKRMRRVDEAFGEELAQQYAKDKATRPADEMRPDTERNVDFGRVMQPTEAMRTRVQMELEQQEARRAKYSRRRGVVDEEDVLFINERNRKFNEKLRRAFDGYTTEIRQNLERGTAL